MLLLHFLCFVSFSYGTTCNRFMLFYRPIQLLIRSTLQRFCFLFFSKFSQSVIDLWFCFSFSFMLWFVCKNMSTTICWVVSGIIIFCLFVFCCLSPRQHRLVQWHCSHNTKVCLFVLDVCIFRFSPPFCYLLLLMLF